MKQAKIFLFNFILIPQLILISSIKTGDAYSKSSLQTNTDEEFVVIQNNNVSSFGNSGNKTGSESESTGNATAVSEMQINNGKVEGKLEVEANGEKKELNIDKPGSYKLEINKKGEISTSASTKTKQTDVKDEPKKDSILGRFLSFIFSFFSLSKK
ncbi:hypothetical protein A3C98_00935 [Candidatus Roizmanbacteria bacterium RIFCSPHIGHO2_02_FULL_37_15]|nr:MAG: hypothetical protein A2859_04105 [Candidatus Roizmanbacteria bacterium RIFCSPHIGHO2_01_FULL_37_16b]OGK22747.1 MAG: hypothetical protein A3C98_00935 [Candidatus Roizmanbacteria bacterium RIFCSPHIGHO2_02_FULL_37_15]OGK33214.1 MAG: hypothetical protein A3F57_05110 [Candidatus Roizmanbacteria bacterium RIFCSPHIGHO2_12_FULL_36_11]OGK55622.1 MAG: hypothetical protein A3I50_01600 [Candidatus Roizmanbacteria bacterium RIFCSPLOWO2_02_FULL_37_9]